MEEHYNQSLQVRLPDEIIHDIVVRLPTKYLLRCSAVCKSWRSLIQSTAFIRTHLNLSLNCKISQSNDQNDAVQQLLLLQSYDKIEKRLVFSLHWDTSPSFSEYSKLVSPILSDHDFYHPEVVGTCNGLVCLAGELTALIWNPCIRKFIVLPLPSSSRGRISQECTRYAFGYDSRSSDYKVLRSVSRCIDGYRFSSQVEVEIWSLATGSWKGVSNANIPVNFAPGICTHDTVHDKYCFVKGALHWIQYSKEGEESLIVLFDLFTEQFGKIVMPKAVWRSSERNPLVWKDVCYVSRYAESLAFFEKRQDLGSDYGIRLCMWVMKEYGVSESWTKLLTISSQGLDRPIGFRKTGEVVVAWLLSLDGRLYKLMDPYTKQSHDFEMDCSSYSYQFMDYFVESLVLLDQPRSMLVSY